MNFDEMTKQELIERLKDSYERERLYKKSLKSTLRKLNEMSNNYDMKLKEAINEGDSARMISMYASKGCAYDDALDIVLMRFGMVGAALIKEIKEEEEKENA